MEALSMEQMESIEGGDRDAMACFLMGVGAGALAGTGNVIAAVVVTASMWKSGCLDYS